jgi:Tol biopolymer transport system component
MLPNATRSKTLSDVEWSQTGTRFAYVIESNRVGKDYGIPYCDETSASLYVASVDGRARRVLVHTGSIASIAWSPDERTLAYVGCSKPTRQCSIYAVGSDGGSPRRISRRTMRSVRWMPSGLELLASESVLSTIDVAIGRTRVVVRSDPTTDCQTSPRLLRVTKDGAWIGAITREFYVFDDCKDVSSATVSLVPYADGHTERFSVPLALQGGQIDSVSLYLNG